VGGKRNGPKITGLLALRLEGKGKQRMFRFFTAKKEGMEKQA
jgi:hypothetical protein